MLFCCKGSESIEEKVESFLIPPCQKNFKGWVIVTDHMIPLYWLDDRLLRSFNREDFFFLSYGLRQEKHYASFAVPPAPV